MTEMMDQEGGGEFPSDEIRPYPFAGTDHIDPVRLGEALATRWEQAVDDMRDPVRTGRFVDWVRQFGAASGHDVAARDLMLDVVEGADPVNFRLLSAVRWLAPRSAATYAGAPLNAETLWSLSSRAVRRGESAHIAAGDLCQEIADYQVLRMLARASGGAELGRIEARRTRAVQRWDQEARELVEIYPRLAGRPEAAAFLQAELLNIAVDEGRAARRLGGAVVAGERRDLAAGVPRWFTFLRDRAGTDAVRLLAVLQCLPEAAEQVSRKTADGPHAPGQPPPYTPQPHAPESRPYAPEPYASEQPHSYAPEQWPHAPGQRPYAPERPQPRPTRSDPVPEGSNPRTVRPYPRPTVHPPAPSHPAPGLAPDPYPDPLADIPDLGDEPIARRGGRADGGQAGALFFALLGVAGVLLIWLLYLGLLVPAAEQQGVSQMITLALVGEAVAECVLAGLLGRDYHPDHALLPMVGRFFQTSIGWLFRQVVDLPSGGLFRAVLAVAGICVALVIAGSLAAAFSIWVPLVVLGGHVGWAYMRWYHWSTGRIR